jgi:hypothetical protein
MLGVTSALRSPAGSSPWVAGALVGAVVLVVGFGSGVGQVGTAHHTAYEASGPLGVTPAPVGIGVAVSPGPAGTPVDAHAASPGGSVVAPPATAARLAVSSTAAAGSMPSTRTPPALPPAPAPAAICAGQPLLDAMIAPLVDHLEKAHLETGVGQQLIDLSSLDQYVKTHTVLLESILSPLLDVLMALPQGLTPLVAHLDKAHLETSPGQQAADLLAVDQYVKTHTVLVGDVAAPVLNAVQGAPAC